MFVALVNIGIALAVPPVVVTFEEAGGGAVVLSIPFPSLVEPAGMGVLYPAGDANMKAEGGNPPMVAASPAFMA
jgi:hypothetical protein